MVEPIQEEEKKAAIDVQPMQDDSEEEKEEEKEKYLDMSSAENTICDALAAIAAFNAQYEESKA